MLLRRRSSSFPFCQTSNQDGCFLNFDLETFDSVTESFTDSSLKLIFFLFLFFCIQILEIEYMNFSVHCQLLC